MVKRCKIHNFTAILVSVKMVKSNDLKTHNSQTHNKFLGKRWIRLCVPIAVSENIETITVFAHNDSADRFVDRIARGYNHAHFVSLFSFSIVMDGIRNKHSKHSYIYIHTSGHMLFFFTRFIHTSTEQHRFYFSVNNNWPIVLNRKLIFKLVVLMWHGGCWHEYTIQAYTGYRLPPSPHTHLIYHIITIHKTHIYRNDGALFNNSTDCNLWFCVFWKLGIPLKHSNLLRHTRKDSCVETSKMTPFYIGIRAFHCHTFSLQWDLTQCDMNLLDVTFRNLILIIFHQIGQQQHAHIGRHFSSLLGKKKYKRK